MRRAGAGADRRRGSRRRQRREAPAARGRAASGSRSTWRRNARAEASRHPSREVRRGAAVEGDDADPIEAERPASRSTARRATIVVVLPLPAGAMICAGPSGSVAAARCSGSRAARIGARSSCGGGAVAIIGSCSADRVIAGLPAAYSAQALFCCSALPDPAVPQHEIRVNRDRYDDVPYDRELIRSGGVAAGESADGAGAAPRARVPHRNPRSAASARAPARGRRRETLDPADDLPGAPVLRHRRGHRQRCCSGCGRRRSTTPSRPLAFPSSALLGSLNGDERVNVLLVGYGGPDHDGPYLADSIQILSIDPTTDTTTTIPIPRDLWIEGVADVPAEREDQRRLRRGHCRGRARARRRAHGRRSSPT